MVKLEPTVRASYGSSSINTGYVQDLASPMRKEYPDSMASDEILSNFKLIAKVVPNYFYSILLLNIKELSDTWSFPQDDPEYNAYERDIAVVNLFFPDATVFGQC